jgi:3-dehydroquinate dehydratase II
MTAGMPRVAVISGPNLDRLGRREPAIYGTTTLAQVHKLVEEAARAAGAVAVCRQSNGEGELVSWIGAAGDDGFAGVVLNAGAYTHTSIAIFDAIKASGVPVVEVHLSNPDAREAFRRRSRIAPACIGRVAGFGPASYVLGLQGLLHHLGHPGAPQSYAEERP